MTLQKQDALLVDIKHIVRITWEKLQKLTAVTTSKHFPEVLFQINSFNAGYQTYSDISHFIP